MNEHRVPLPLFGKPESLCFGCAHYAWSLLVPTESGMPAQWCHECRSDLDCIPGDYVTECEGFEPEGVK